MSTKDYPAPGITVHWEPGICRHSGVCARSLPTVFRPRDRPWIDQHAAAADEIAATVDACPSGALTYTRTPADDDPATDPR